MVTVPPIGSRGNDSTATRSPARFEHSNSNSHPRPPTCRPPKRPRDSQQAKFSRASDIIGEAHAKGPLSAAATGTLSFTTTSPRIHYGSVPVSVDGSTMRYCCFYPTLVLINQFSRNLRVRNWLSFSPPCTLRSPVYCFPTLLLALIRSVSNLHQTDCCLDWWIHSS